jgi:hypothetical protein
VERHDFELRLEQSRAELRCLLLPDPRSGHPVMGMFPRSMAMRLILFGLPVIANMATRSPLLQSLVREVASRLR